jgi:hypothetical protein
MKTLQLTLLAVVISLHWVLENRVNHQLRLV